MNNPFLRLLESALLSRAELASRAGITFGGKRDTFEVLGFTKNLTLDDYRQRYERNSVAGRIVDAFPSATFRGTGGEIIENEDVEVVTAFEQAWMDLATRLGVWSVFKRADILAGLGRYAVILIGAPGLLDQPLANLTAENIFFLQAYGEADAEIKSWENDATSPRFGKPTLYSLKRLTADTSRIAKDVHWTRIIHIADGLLDDHVYGQPRLKRVWNDLDNLDKLTGGGSEAFWLRAHQGYQFDVDKDLKPDPKEKEDMRDQVDEFIHGMRRAVRTRGVTIETLGSDVADFSTNADTVLSLLSAGTGIPKRILMGSERGELASTQDRENWTERVQDRRDDYAGPIVVRQFVDRLIEFGALPKPVEYEVLWPAVNDLTDEQKLDVAVKYATVNQAAGETVVTANEIRDKALGMEPLDPEDLEDDVEDVEVDDEDEDEDLDEDENEQGLQAASRNTKMAVLRRRKAHAIAFYVRKKAA